MKFDARFLSLHPATAAWFAQRETCRRCEWFIEIVGTRELDSLRCRKSPQTSAIGVRKDRRFDFCIDARQVGGVCGPAAALFSPRQRPGQ